MGKLFSNIKLLLNGMGLVMVGVGIVISATVTVFLFKCFVIGGIAVGIAKEVKIGYSKTKL